MKNQVKAGAILTLVSLFIGNVISLGYTPFMLKSLGQIEYGLYGLANSIVGYLTVLDFGFGNAAVRYTAKYKAESCEYKLKYMYGMFISIYVIIGLVTFILGLIISQNAGVFFTKVLTTNEIEIVRKLLILASINLAVSFPLGVFTAIITAYERFTFLKITLIVRYLINPLVLIPVLLLGYKSIGLICATTVLNIIFLLGNLLYCLRKLKVRISFKKFDFNLLKELFSYSLWIFVGSIVNQLWWNSGQFMLGIYSSAVSIALYNLAMQFKSYFETFATSVSGVFLPRLTSMESQKLSNEVFTESFIKVGRLQFILISLITTGFILFGKQFICIWAGEDYELAYYITLIIFIPLSLVDTQTLGIAILQAKNKHKFRSIVYLCVVIVCITFCIPLIKKFDVFGCAIATASALTIGNIFIMNWYYHKRIGLNVFRFWKEIIKIFPGVLVSAFTGYFCLVFMPPLHTYKLLLPSILCYVFIFFTVLYFLSMNKYERGLVMGVFAKIKGMEK